jgi:hypothetical protein
MITLYTDIAFLNTENDLVDCICHCTDNSDVEWFVVVGELRCRESSYKGMSAAQKGVDTGANSDDGI